MFHNSKCLWFTYCVAVGMVLANLAASSTISRTEMDEETLATQIELDEYDFEDICNLQLVPIEWGNTLANHNLRSEVSESLAASQREKATAEDYSGHTVGEYSNRAAVIARKLELISKPGDVLLQQEDYQHLLTFSERVNAASNMSVSCESTSDSFNETSEIFSASNQTSCVSDKTAYLRDEYAHLLKLVPKAAKLNGFDDVESYWLLISELPDDSYQRATTLWADVKPLYQKLSRWISESIDKKCRSKRDSDTSSVCDSSRASEWRLTHDWTNLADFVLPKECKETFRKLQANLEESQMKGKKLFETTEKMTQILEIGNLPSAFWEYSVFNQSCPSRYQSSCRGDFSVAACSSASWSDYLDAHEISIRAISTQLSNSNDDLTYLLKNGNRFSALSEAVVGLGPLIAANSHYLSQRGIIKNAPCAKDTLATLLALRIIPKLPFYLMADLARIEALASNGTVAAQNAWRSLRSAEDSQGTFEENEEGNDWWDFLDEDRIATNQPYISQFYGLFIQFQLFEELLKSDESVSDDGDEFIRSSQQIRDLLKLGKSKKWPVLLEESFQISKITSAPLVRFFNRFDTFISPFIVPKDAKKMPVPMPLPDIDLHPKTVIDEASGQKNDSTATKTILPNVPFEPSGRNETETGEPVEEQAENTNYIIGAVIASIIVGTVAIVIVVYKRHLTKRQYQRPPDQQA